MSDIFEREINLIGEEAFLKLKKSNVAVFGIGGVGGYVAEALARAGVGNITLVDSDTVSESNINRQIIATIDTVGIKKTQAMKERILSVNPGCNVACLDTFYLPENADSIDLSLFDYIADAIDTVSAKIELAVRAYKNNIKIISSMGTGNKLHPEMLKISDISKTSVCPLARVMRRELKQRGINHMKVVYSEEQPVLTGSRVPSSISFVPPAAGLIMAGEIIRDLAGLK